MESSLYSNDGTAVPSARLPAVRRWTAADRAVGSPLVSVVIACYNQSRYLVDAIESVLNQTYPHLEVIVVDDGSQDNTAAVVARFPAIQYLRQRNRGVSVARNSGLRLSRGAYVLFLDSDDRLLPDALDIGVAEMTWDPSCAFVSGCCRHIAFDGTPQTGGPVVVVRSEHYAELLRNCYIWMPGVVLFRRIALQVSGAFDAVYDPSEDHELYLRLARQHPVRCHDRIVGEYRRHSGNATRDPGANLRGRMLVLRAQRRFVRKQGRLIAAYRQGLAFAQEFYGNRLVDDVSNALAQRRLGVALRGLRTLIRYYPKGAVQAAVRAARGR